MIASFFWSWWHYNYAGNPWYAGSIWPNVFVIPVAAVVLWVWAQTKFWPLKPLEREMARVHRKLDAHEAMHQMHADKLDRLARRIEALHTKKETK